jgi:hypothetical protein
VPDAPRWLPPDPTVPSPPVSKKALLSYNCSILAFVGSTVTLQLREFRTVTLAFSAAAAVAGIILAISGLQEIHKQPTKRSPYFSWFAIVVGAVDLAWIFALAILN